MSAPLRADARRNLGRVLDAAAEVLAEQGPSASVDEIARRAGVGHGTVFRRFPTKEALVAAVVQQRLAELTAKTDDLAADPDADRAFEAFVWHLGEVFARDRAIFEGLPQCGELAEVVEAKSRFLDAVRRVVTRAQVEGTIRSDLVPEDVPMLVGCAIIGTTWADRDAWRRFVAIALDGLRSR